MAIHVGIHADMVLERERRGEKSYILIPQAKGSCLRHCVCLEHVGDTKALLHSAYFHQQGNIHSSKATPPNTCIKITGKL